MLEAEARRRHDDTVTDEALRIIAELVDADAIASLVVQETAAVLDFAIEPAVIQARLEEDRVLPWGAAVAAEIADRRGADDIRQRVTAMLAERGIGGNPA